MLCYVMLCYIMLCCCYVTLCYVMNRKINIFPHCFVLGCETWSGTLRVCVCMYVLKITSSNVCTCITSSGAYPAAEFVTVLLKRETSSSPNLTVPSFADGQTCT